MAASADAPASPQFGELAHLSSEEEDSGTSSSAPALNWFPNGRKSEETVVRHYRGRGKSLLADGAEDSPRKAMPAAPCRSASVPDLSTGYIRGGISSSAGVVTSPAATATSPAFVAKLVGRDVAADVGVRVRVVDRRIARYVEPTGVIIEVRCHGERVRVEHDGPQRAQRYYSTGKGDSYDLVVDESRPVGPGDFVTKEPGTEANDIKIGSQQPVEAGDFPDGQERRCCSTVPGTAEACEGNTSQTAPRLATKTGRTDAITSDASVGSSSLSDASTAQRSGMNLHVLDSAQIQQADTSGKSIRHLQRSISNEAIEQSVHFQFGSCLADQTESQIVQRNQGERKASATVLSALLRARVQAGNVPEWDVTRDTQAPTLALANGTQEDTTNATNMDRRVDALERAHGEFTRLVRELEERINRDFETLRENVKKQKDDSQRFALARVHEEVEKRSREEFARRATDFEQRINNNLETWRETVKKEKDDSERLMVARVREEVEMQVQNALDTTGDHFTAIESRILARVIAEIRNCVKEMHGARYSQMETGSKKCSRSSGNLDRELPKEEPTTESGKQSDTADFYGKDYRAFNGGLNSLETQENAQLPRHVAKTVQINKTPSEARDNNLSSNQQEVDNLKQEVAQKALQVTEVRTKDSTLLPQNSEEEEITASLRRDADRATEEATCRSLSSNFGEARASPQDCRNENEVTSAKNGEYAHRFTSATESNSSRSWLGASSQLLADVHESAPADLGASTERSQTIGMIAKRVSASLGCKAIPRNSQLPGANSCSTDDVRVGHPELAVEQVGNVAEEAHDCDGLDAEMLRLAELRRFASRVLGTIGPSSSLSIDSAPCSNSSEAEPQHCRDAEEVSTQPHAPQAKNPMTSPLQQARSACTRPSWPRLDDNSCRANALHEPKRADASSHTTDSGLEYRNRLGFADQVAKSLQNNATHNSPPHRTHQQNNRNGPASIINPLASGCQYATAPQDLTAFTQPCSPLSARWLSDDVRPEELEHLTLGQGHLETPLKGPCKQASGGIGGVRRMEQHFCQAPPEGLFNQSSGEVDWFRRMETHSGDCRGQPGEDLVLQAKPVLAKRRITDSSGRVVF